MAATPNTVRRNVERGLYTWAAIAAIVVVFAGFARTFYLKLAFGTPALPLLLHLHGIVMTSWFVLFLVQARLVVTGNTRIHRRLGVLGALLAATVVVVGTTVAIHGARLGHAPPGPPPLVFLIVPLGDMLVFTILIGCALWLRHRSDVHKRLMVLACIGILTAAAARIPPASLPAGTAVIAGLSATVAMVLACVAYDTIRNRRLHPAFGWGGALVIVSWPLRLALSDTPAWLNVATWLTQ
jgi:hypothetical protein